jgi:hypothetical protein
MTALIPVQYANLACAILTIIIGIIGEPRYVARSSIWPNACFFILTYLTTDLSLEFTVLLFVYFVLAFAVLSRPKSSDLGQKKRQNLIAFLFLGSRGYGSMLLSMALFERGLLGWLDQLSPMSYLVWIGSLRYVLVGWLLILFLVHLFGRILKKPAKTY